MAGNNGREAEENGGNEAVQAAPVDEAAAVAPVSEAPRREYSTTFRNNPAVIVGGYTYVKKSTVKGVTYWRCSNCNKGCKAAGKSYEAAPLDVVVTNDDHSHDPDPAKKLVVEARKLAAEHKLTAATAIVDDLMRGLEDDVALAVDRKNLLRVAHRAKRLDGSRQLNVPLANIVFSEAFTKTATGLRFLIYDSRLHEPHETVIFIFALPSGLHQLRQRDNWSAAGTFWVTPRLFDSLYTVHANIGNSSVPGAYMLLQDRHEETYKPALRALLRYGNLRDVAPSTFMHDFELAAINAIKAVFPESLIRLCLFHFAQALWRKIQELGLAPLYKSVKKARILLRCFGALATVPVEDVSTALDEVVHEINELRDLGEIPAEYDGALAGFLEYFQKTYVHRLDADGTLAASRYRPMMWNCFLEILQELHRTNNAVEGWHLEFKNTFTSAHPALDKFIAQLQNDEDKNRQRLLRHEVMPGNPLRERRRPAYMASDKHILALARKYRTDYAPAGQVLRYLKCMQHHLVRAEFDDGAEAEDGGQHPPAPDAGDGDDDVADDDIPLNESHPGDGVGDNSDKDVDQGNRQAVVDAASPGGPVHLPEAIGEYERLYYRYKLDAEWSPSKGSASSPSASKSKPEASGSRLDVDDEYTSSKASHDVGDGSEYDDDAHLNDMSSDDSNWAAMVDAQGRPGTDPEGKCPHPRRPNVAVFSARAAIRKEWAARDVDETFKTPTTEGSASSDSDDVSERVTKASVKPEALSDDSLLQELKANATPPATPDNGTAARAGRRCTAARLLTFKEYVCGRKKVASDPALPTGPSGSGLQLFKKRSAAKDTTTPKASTSQLYKRIKREEDDEPLPAMPAFPAGPSANKAVEVIDLTSDEDVITIDSD